MTKEEITLDNIEITSNAVFYKLNKPLSKNVIKQMFTDIVKNKNGVRKTCKDWIRNNTREEEVFISYLVFYVEKNPPFIKNLNLKERKYSYLLLMELNDTLVVSSLNTPGVYKYLNKYIDEFGFEVIANTFSDLSPSYEKVRSQSTSILGDNIRKKVLEGVSLEKRIDGYNSIPLSVSLKTEDAKNSITMSTSRISTNNGRASIRDFTDWSKSIITGINSTNKDTFINTFATPVKLDEIKKKKLKPMGILLNLYSLEEKLFENEHENFKICKKNKQGDLIEVSTEEIKKLFELLNEPLLIGTFKSEKYKIRIKEYDIYLKVTSKSILVQNKELSSLYLCNDSNKAISQKLNSIINKEQKFTIVFNNSSYIYTNRELFLNKDIFNNIESIYSIFETYDEIKDCKAEKSVGKFKSTDTEFKKDSLFGIVEKNIWKKEGHLICDDLGDEWADHIAIYNSKEKGEIPYINFYISKHGENTTGASKFHDVIGQAHKNLGNINFKKEEILNKIRLWKSSNYSNTNITKLRSSGTWDEVESDSIAVLENPLTLRNMYLVVSFLSLSKLKEDIKSFSENKKGYEHIPQLIWFISTFIGQCKEHNVKPRIICMP